MLIDAHAHLQNELFNKDLDKVIERAKKSGVKAVINAAANPYDNEQVLRLAEKYSMIKPALGFHPKYVNNNSVKKIKDIKKLITSNKNKIIAIGEVGLDYHHTAENKELQIKIFTEFIKIAERINKPVIVHSRKAEADVIKILENSKLKKIVMHCFDGKKSQVKQITNNGWYFSIPANIVRSFQLQDIVKTVNINQLLAETDSPYLSPYKDKRNEPAFVVEAYKKIAELKEMDIKEVENNIYMNYEKLFL